MCVQSLLSCREHEKVVVAAKVGATRAEAMTQAPMEHDGTSTTNSSSSKNSGMNDGKIGMIVTGTKKVAITTAGANPIANTGVTVGGVWIQTLAEMMWWMVVVMTRTQYRVMIRTHCLMQMVSSVNVIAVIVTVITVHSIMKM